MPTISIRGNEMPASPIRKLAPLADAAKQRGYFYQRGRRAGSSEGDQEANRVCAGLFRRV